MNLDKSIITDVLHVVCAHSPKGRIHKMDNRPCYGLSFTADEGVITYKHKGKSFVSDKNNAVILPKGQSYTIYRQQTGDFALINFECEQFYADTVIVLPIKDIEPAIKEFEYMKKLSAYDENRLMLISSLYKILYQLTNHNRLMSGPFAPALSYIEKNYSEVITNEILAKQCSFSEEYFRKQFKKVYGISPKKYLIDRRINIAKQLLTEGTLKIQAISEKCGFSNPYHFCRLFKEKTGVSPTEYMRANKIYY
ncbi:MAG: helix-turn-helix transcriptional regulator [Ruminococcaceae bacterium]|nr:helix-turn-helix transcriptional regulator [Oscillospiraceae bacterium]